MKIHHFQLYGEHIPVFPSITERTHGAVMPSLGKSRKDSESRDWLAFTLLLSESAHNGHSPGRDETAQAEQTMKILLKLMTAIMLVAIASHSASAGPVSYECKIKEVFELADDGSISKPKSAWPTGETFHVSRVTGEILGPIFGTGLRKVQMINSGSKGYWFAHLTLTASGNAAGGDYLLIDEASSSNGKPFVGLVEQFKALVVSGTCR